MGARLTGMLALAGAMLGFFVSLIAPHRYLATTTLRVGTETGETVSARLLAVETLTPLLYREPNLKEMAEMYPVNEVLDMVRQSAKVKSSEGNIAVTYEDDNADRALSIDRELAVTATKILAKSEIVGAPHTEPTGATPTLTTAIGFAAGMVAGLLAWTVGRTQNTPPM